MPRPIPPKVYGPITPITPEVRLVGVIDRAEVFCFRDAAREEATVVGDWYRRRERRMVDCSYQSANGRSGSEGPPKNG